MTNEQATTVEVEINGVKMEIDTRYAKRIDTLRVGTKVKLLVKNDGYGSKSSDVYPGVVVGFEPFTDLPTIIVCYLKLTYGEAKLEFAYVNTETNEKYDLVSSIDEHLPVAKADVLSKLDKEVQQKQSEIADLEAKRAYFLKNFNHYFEAEVA